MPPKKKFNKKKVFLFKKNFNNRAINSIVIQCKANNGLLNCGKKYPYLDHEKPSTITKSG